MKKLLLSMFIFISGCSLTVDGSSVNAATKFCENHGGVTRLNVFFIEDVKCGDGSFITIRKAIENSLKNNP